MTFVAGAGVLVDKLTGSFGSEISAIVSSFAIGVTVAHSFASSVQFFKKCQPCFSEYITMRPKDLHVLSKFASIPSDRRLALLGEMILLPKCTPLVEDSTGTLYSYFSRDIPLSMTFAGIQVILPSGIGVHGVLQDAGVGIANAFTHSRHTRLLSKRKDGKNQRQEKQKKMSRLQYEHSFVQL